MDPVTRVQILDGTGRIFVQKKKFWIQTNYTKLKSDLVSHLAYGRVLG